MNIDAHSFIQSIEKLILKKISLEKEQNWWINGIIDFILLEINFYFEILSIF